MINEEFMVSLTAYINYISRKMKKDPNYDPYPLVKAMNVAIEAASDGNFGEIFMGVSGDAIRYQDDTPRESYAVVIRKEEYGFTILEVRDLINGRVVPLEATVFLIMLCMKMDKHEGGNLPVNDAIILLNETIPELNMVRFNNEEWLEARNSFRRLLTEEKFHIPANLRDEAFEKDIQCIREDNILWEDYPPRIRSMIAVHWVSKQEVKPTRGNINVISSVDEIIEKYKLLQTAREFLYGKASDYFIRNKISDDLGVYYEENRSNKKYFKVGRNNPCPCGSGKKYKKCCSR